MVSDSDKRRVLAVCDDDEAMHGLDALGQSGWDVAICADLDEVLGLVLRDAVDAVALPFDPMDEAARDTFLRLAHLQQAGRPVLVSYAQRNPDWIENLVFGAGANIHLRGGLDFAAVFRALDQWHQGPQAQSA